MSTAISSRILNVLFFFFYPAILYAHLSFCDLHATLFVGEHFNLICLSPVDGTAGIYTLPHDYIEFSVAFFGEIKVDEKLRLSPVAQ